MLANIPKVVSSYYALTPDPVNPAHQVAFGTSGHRGSSLKGSFNEQHILAVSQAVCDYRKGKGISGPLFLGMDTHALSEPAFISALEVLAANGVTVMIQEGLGYTPTPVISHAILSYNRGRTEGLADGIVITPSHNPPEDGGFKYNPPHGGPAEPEITGIIETRANALLANQLSGIKWVPYDKALKAATTIHHDYIGPLYRGSGQRARHAGHRPVRPSDRRRSPGWFRHSLLGANRRALRIEPDRREPRGGPGLRLHAPG